MVRELRKDIDSVISHFSKTSLLAFLEPLVLANLVSTSKVLILMGRRGTNLASNPPLPQKSKSNAYLLSQMFHLSLLTLDMYLGLDAYSTYYTKSQLFATYVSYGPAPDLTWMAHFPLLVDVIPSDDCFLNWATGPREISNLSLQIIKEIARRWDNLRFNAYASCDLMHLAAIAC